MPPCPRAANRSRVRPARTGHWPPATDHWQLTTGNYPLSTEVPQSAPAVPCKSLRSVLYCKVGPKHNRAGPERAASHNSPPTMPGPPTMSTCSERHVRILPPAHIAPGPAATRLGILSRKACNRHDIAHFLHQNDTFCAFSVQERQGTDRDRILLRESTPISCHEERESFFKVGPIRPKQRIRYPIDTLSIPGFRKNRSHSASHLDAPGPILDRIGPTAAHMRDATVQEADATTELNVDFGARWRSGPQLGPLRAHRAGRRHPRHRRIRCQEPPFRRG